MDQPPKGRWEVARQVRVGDLLSWWFALMADGPGQWAVQLSRRKREQLEELHTPYKTMHFELTLCRTSCKIWPLLPSSPSPFISPRIWERRVLAELSSL